MVVRLMRAVWSLEGAHGKAVLMNGMGDLLRQSMMREIRLINLAVQRP